MPLVYQQNINEATRMAVWHIGEDESFFLGRINHKPAISHPHKRLQHLAGRYLLAELFENFPLKLIQVAETKKPFLADEAYHFSISHAGDYAAAIVSRHDRVGVDIERLSEKVCLIRNKFLTGAEQEMLSDFFNHNDHTYISEMQLFAFCWSVKESIFKWYGHGGVDFKLHLRINSISQNLNEFIADCSFLKNEELPLRVHGIYFNENFLTWVVSKY